MSSYFFLGLDSKAGSVSKSGLYGPEGKFVCLKKIINDHLNIHTFVWCSHSEKAETQRNF